MTKEQFITKYKLNLTDQQMSAVTATEVPTLLLAVPGSGKTTVLVYRLGYMIYCQNIFPAKMLTLTYTVPATIEMKNRFAGIFGQDIAASMEFRTINGLCAQIINSYAKHIGRQPFQLMADDGSRAKLLSLIYQKVEKKYPNESDIQNIITLITYIKNMMLSEKEIEKLGDKEKLSLLKIYNEYNRELRNQSLMDYDDQMIYALNMLKSTPALLEEFQNKHQYISVDEAQDTSKIQHEIIRILASKYENMFMVGDEDQSIYGFRAAYPEALLNFETIYPNGKVLLMEDNFRSNGEIVLAADRFIQQNTLRHKKTMKPFRPMESKIHLVDIKNRKDQYEYLKNMAQNCTEETAVLYRDNESILPVVDLLEKEGIPYRIKNMDLSFFSSKIVMDVENIIRFGQNQTDTERFLQIYYKIGTFVGKNVAEKAVTISKQKNISVLEAVLICDITPAGTKKSVREIMKHMKFLNNENATSSLYRIINAIGYGEYLEKNNMKTGKLDILRAIASNQPSADAFLNRLKQLSEIIKEKKNGPSNLIFSTMHSSKGLEYDNFYIMDVIDGIFPEKTLGRNMATEEIKEYEEERRLFYVAVTRAKNNLHIFCEKGAKTFVNQLMGIENKTEKLNFHDSLKTRTSNIANKERNGTGNVSDKGKTSTSYRAGKVSKPYNVFSDSIEISYKDYSEKLEEIKRTGMIHHKKLGTGTVYLVDGETLHIQFESGKIKLNLKTLMKMGLIL